MKSTFLTLFTLCCLVNINAQVAISGKVIDSSTAEPIIFANVYEVGSTNFTETNLEGEFSLTVSEGSEVEISYLGYENYRILVEENKTVYDVSLQTDAVALDEVIVTAFGIEKEKKAAGFSFSEINGDELNQAREINVASQLVGKVAGVEITKPSNGAGGATRIAIRGLAQFGGGNEPLVVVDGVFLNNTNANSASLYGGRDSGDGLTALNPDDIENITVLKGLSATTLYGARGANGVLIITTKSGVKQKGIGVSYSSNFVTENAFLFPNYQQEYGQGANGLKPTSQEEAFKNWRSWGAKLDGSETPIFNGETLPYSAVGKDDIASFYERGQTWTNALSFNTGNDKLTTRTSLSQTANKGIIQKSRYRKYSINTNLSYKPIKKLTLSAKANLIQEEAEHRTNLTDNPNNPSKYFTIAPANLPQTIFQQTRDENGVPIPWSDNPFTLSPYWGINENPNDDIKRRILAMGSARYEILDWLATQFRVTTDQGRQDFFNTDIDGTPYNPQGAVYVDTLNLIETNYDFLIMADKAINKNLGLQVNLGATRNDRYSNRYGQSGSGFIEPGISTLENTMIVRPIDNRGETRQRINALFANTTISINNFLYLEGSFRKDFFSVLTDPNRPNESDDTVNYGGGSLSFILSDAIKPQKWLSFAKLRIGYGTAGFSNIDPYNQVPTYFISTDPKDLDGSSLPIANINGDRASNPFLQPSLTTAFEFGTDLKFFNNRLALDATYYDQVTSNHNISNPLPSSSGYNSVILNAGEVRNNGVEFLFIATPIKRSSFSWSTSINFAKNINTVVKINEGLSQLNFGADRTFSANIVAREGGNIGQIWGNVYDRNSAGEIIHDNNGLPQIADDREVLGNFTPDWYGGLTNTISFKELSLTFLIDTKQGGEILSTTSSFGYLFGRHINTLPGRENPDFTIVGQGVGPDGETPNTTPANLKDYYERISSITEENTYDASYIKLRQVTLGYTMNKKALEKLKFVKGLNISLVGRNLYFFQNGLDEIGLDPESIYTATGSDVGIEYAALPSTRTFGVNLKVDF